MRGILILTEGRSGSNWLCSLMRSSGVMGNPGEWLSYDKLGSRPATADAYIEAILKKGSTENGRFAVKIFPRHLRVANLDYGIDFIQECRRRYHVEFVRLSRRDRFRQAISRARGMMTMQWTSKGEAKANERYDFQLFAESYFTIERSEAFWDSYLALASLTAKTFVYEDLIDDPSPFIGEVAELLDVAKPASLQSDLKIQRDAKTEEWLSRFKQELQNTSPLAYSTGKPVSRTVRNLRNFFKRKLVTPL